MHGFMHSKIAKVDPSVRLENLLNHYDFFFLTFFCNSLCGSQIEFVSMSFQCMYPPQTLKSLGHRLDNPLSSVAQRSRKVGPRTSPASLGGSN